MNLTEKDWLDPDLGDDAWKQATIVSGFTDKDVNTGFGTYMGWMLQDNVLPQMELSPVRLSKVRKAEGAKVSDLFLAGKDSIVVPPHTKAEIIFDNGTLTNAYPVLDFSGGKGGSITLGYAEALYDDHMAKNNRDEIEGRHFVGRRDSIVCDGGRREFVPMTWRTYRYLVLRAYTGDSPMTINGLDGIFTGFPFRLQAELRTDDPSLDKIFEIGWRTARLCAVETYMDCPYYEQLQYFGDSRIQALVSLYMTGDDRLVKNLLDMAEWSRNSAGITQSRYPSSLAQWIQPYGLSVVFTLHDYMMYGGDMDFLRDKLMTERTILDYFHHYQGPDGRVVGLPGWNFTDWVDGQKNWRGGVALPGADGCNSVMDLQLLYAYRMAADLERKEGLKELAGIYDERASQLAETIRKNYWRESAGLFSDRSDEDVFSQHAAALAILSGLVEGDDAKAMAEKLEKDASMAPASIYFKYYANQAIVEAGLGDDYLGLLGKWRENIDKGLTTWAETSDVDASRSDCHAWGSSPNIELFRTVLGIDSGAPGFGRVRVAPNLGDLKEIGGTMAIPSGKVSVDYKVRGGRLDAVIVLPASAAGTFVWKGKSYDLKGGENRLKL